MVNTLIEQEVMSEDRTDNISCPNRFKVGLEENLKRYVMCCMHWKKEERD